MNLDQDEILDRRLREAMPYIDDDGFTGRVLQKLPRPQYAAARARSVILIGTTVVATLLTYLLAARFVNESIARLTTLPPMWLLALSLMAGLFLSAIGSAAAMLKTRELSL